MPIDFETRFLGIQVNKQEVRPGKIFHYNDTSWYGSQSYSWPAPYHERVEVLSQDTLSKEIEYLTGFQDQYVTFLSRDEINTFRVEIPSRIPGVTNTLIWKGPEVKASE